MLLRFLDAHGHDNQTSKAFNIRNSSMQPCDHAEYRAITSIPSPYPLQFQPTMVEQLNALITPAKVSSR
jgi:cytidine deaminase